MVDKSHVELVNSRKFNAVKLTQNLSDLMNSAHDGVYVDYQGESKFIPNGSYFRETTGRNGEKIEFIPMSVNEVRQ